jgi:hypothetical protein
MSKAIEQAARNNAEWCDTVARMHDAAGRFAADVWFSERKLPPFYPNLVTLTAQGEAAQRECIAALIERGPPLPWAVKDSFAQLDLTSWGFDCLFEARWISYSQDAPASARADGPLQWRRIDSADALAAWEKAWRRGQSPGSTSIFRAALLKDRAIAILAGSLGDEIVAGCVLNLSAEAIGLSNLFAPEDMRAAAWRVCRDHASASAPDRPIVGYEQGEDLVFQELGPLRVWLRTGAAD